MGIEWFRDLSITVACFALTLVIILAGVVMFQLYRSSRSILTSIKKASQGAEEIVSTVKEEVIKPLVQAAALLRFVGLVSEQVRKMLAGKESEGEKDGKK